MRVESPVDRQTQKGLSHWDKVPETTHFYEDLVAIPRQRMALQSKESCRMHFKRPAERRAEQTRRTSLLMHDAQHTSSQRDHSVVAETGT